MNVETALRSRSATPVSMALVVADFDVRGEIVAIDIDHALQGFGLRTLEVEDSRAPAA